MIFREKFKTLKNVFDLSTEASLFKLISQGHLEGLESPISIGKEANIFTAITKQNERRIVKIYRTSVCDFNRMYSYIAADPRFPSVKRSRRQVVFAWAQREYRNLMLAREAGVRCPLAFACAANVLVMEFLGDDVPAPKLKDAFPTDMNSFFDDVVQNMRKLHKADLVHGDLSPFNILNLHEKPYFIDFSQTTTFENPNAQMYLERDIRNVCSFFRKQGLSVDEKATHKKVTD